MMMNMMTGAVAINGGVGVMEVRQPQMVEKAVQDAGHIAADIAENAHITLHELKEKIDAVVEKKLPSFKALMEMKPMAVAQTTVDDASLTVYQNGYAVYEMDDAHTVIAVNENLDCYENLANAIILQAVKDYKKALRQLEGNPRNQEARHDKVRLEKFFRSQWYGVLTELDPERLMAGVKENVQHEMNERRRKKAEKLRRKTELRGS